MKNYHKNTICILVYCVLILCRRLNQLRLLRVSSSRRVEATVKFGHITEIIWSSTTKSPVLSLPYTNTHKVDGWAPQRYFFQIRLNLGATSKNRQIKLLRSDNSPPSRPVCNKTRVLTIVFHFRWLDPQFFFCHLHYL